MTKEEFAKFCMALKTYYPKENILPNMEAMELWYCELGDIPFDTAAACLRKWVNLNSWSPSIAQIREMCAEIVCGESKSWQDGWSLVQEAISHFGTFQVQEAMDWLHGQDAITAGCVERMGFRQLCLSENAVADRAAFRGCYEILQKRDKEDKQLSLPLRQLLKTIGNGNGLLQIGDDSGEHPA